MQVFPQRLALWLRDQAATPDFIETGTYLADTALWAVQHFERVISIEADRELCDAARKRLASYANVNVLLGRSPRRACGLGAKAEQAGPDMARCPLVRWRCRGWQESTRNVRCSKKSQPSTPGQYNI